MLFALPCLSLGQARELAADLVGDALALEREGALRLGSVICGGVFAQFTVPTLSIHDDRVEGVYETMSVLQVPGAEDVHPAAITSQNSRDDVPLFEVSNPRMKLNLRTRSSTPCFRSAVESDLK